MAKSIKDQFEKDNPGIRLESSPATLPDIWARVEKEQQAGQYLWDVYMFGPTLEMFALKDKGGFAPFRDFMVGPDVGDASAWEGGYDKFFFLDNEKKFINAVWLRGGTFITINRDLLPSAQIRSVEDLVKPDYKGKIVMQDPRAGGSGVSFLAAVTRFKGRDGVKRLLVDQETMIVRGNQEMADQVVRGGRAISLSTIDEDQLTQYRNAGVKLNLENVPLSDVPTASNGALSPAVFKNSPHPNATKVFVNWLLSAKTQAYLAADQRQNSLRKGVAPGNPAFAPSPGTEYFHTQMEQSMAVEIKAAQQLARELIPS